MLTPPPMNESMSPVSRDPQLFLASSHTNTGLGHGACSSQRDIEHRGLIAMTGIGTGPPGRLLPPRETARPPWLRASPQEGEAHPSQLRRTLTPASRSLTRTREDQLRNQPRGLTDLHAKPLSFKAACCTAIGNGTDVQRLLLSVCVRSVSTWHMP